MNNPIKRRPIYRGRSPNHSTASRLKKRSHYQHQITKYLAMARESVGQGDRIQAESFYQHADHFHRLLLEIGPRVEEEIDVLPQESFEQEEHNEAL